MHKTVGSPPQYPQPQPQPPRKSGMGFGFFVLLLGLGGCTLGACYVLPEIGWTGWGVIIGAWYFGKHLENQAAIRAELAEMNARQRYGHSFDDD